MTYNKFVKCPGCGTVVMDIAGPVHRYIGAVAGCWNIYRKVLAGDNIRNNSSELHRLVVDTYSVQHPGNESGLTIQSVAVHLLGLYFTLVRGFDNSSTLEQIRNILRNNNKFFWLSPPNEPGNITIADVYKSGNPEQQSKIIKSWADEVWKSWHQHHKTIEEWAHSAD